MYSQPLLTESKIAHTLPKILSPAVFIADAHYMVDSTPKPAILRTPYNDKVAHTASLPSDTPCTFDICEHSNNDQFVWYQNIELETSVAPYPRYIGENGLLGLLEHLIASPPAQIFLMGDIAHLLIGHLPSSTKQHRDFLAIINKLARLCEVVYFEGNHDFGLDSALFPNVRIYPRSLQPAVFMYNDKCLFLSHGDYFIGTLYEAYIRTMNAPLTLSLLKLLDILSVGYLYNAITARINAKQIYNMSMPDEVFRWFANKRMQSYKQYAKRLGISIPFGVIEGHFHIGMMTKNFIALPSFYCNQRIFVL